MVNKKGKSWEEDLPEHEQRTWKEIKAITSTFPKPKATAVFLIDEGLPEKPERFKKKAEVFGGAEIE